MPNWIASIEYHHYDLGSVTYNAGTRTSFDPALVLGPLPARFYCDGDLSIRCCPRRPELPVRLLPVIDCCAVAPALRSTSAFDAVDGSSTGT
jgi:hypothetical protein